MHPMIQQSVVQMLLALLALMFLAHVLLSILGFKQAIPKLLKGLATGIGRGIVWSIEWIVGLIRDAIFGAGRGLWRGRPRRGGRGRRRPPP